MCPVGTVGESMYPSLLGVARHTRSSLQKLTSGVGERGTPLPSATMVPTFEGQSPADPRPSSEDRV
jgi:hypothetical protein